MTELAATDALFILINSCQLVVLDYLREQGAVDKLTLEVLVHVAPAVDVPRVAHPLIKHCNPRLVFQIPESKWLLDLIMVQHVGEHEEVRERFVNGEEHDPVLLTH